MTEDHRLIKSAKSARDGNVSESIPEDVIKAATDFQDMIDGDPKAYTAFDVAVLATLAERDRCAKIAESEKYNTDVQLSLPPQSGAAYAIYQAIRRR